MLRRLLLGADLVFMAAAIAGSGTVDVNVFSWNVHWQCGSDHIPGCRDKADARFVELVHETHADIALAVELEVDSETPQDLAALLPPGWTQVNGSCLSPGKGRSGDVAALLLAPSLRVVAADGGCLGGTASLWHNVDARAFAVARVELASAIPGCEHGLCVTGLHAPHGHITLGSDLVEHVCGEARHGCTLAMGDWNAPLSRHPFPYPPKVVADLWSELFGAPLRPLVGAPSGNSCCFPETKYRGDDDHAVTDIAGATVLGTTLFDYQLQMGDTEEHKPIAVQFGFLTSPALVATQGVS